MIEIDGHFLVQVIGTAFGGVAAWMVIKVDVAKNAIIAEAAAQSAKDAHERLDHHIDTHHTTRGGQ